MSATCAILAVICVLLFGTIERSEMQFALTAGLHNLQRQRAGGGTLRSGVTPFATPGVDAEPLKPARGFRGPHEGTVGMRLRPGSTCRTCEELLTSAATSFKVLPRRLPSRSSRRSCRERRGPLQDENPERPEPNLRDKDRGRRRGGTSKGAVSPTVADSNTEVRGRGATSPTAAAGAMAAGSPMTLDKVDGTVRGDTVASPMTAMAMEAAVRAGATAGQTVGGNRVLVGRAHPGAVRAPTRPLGPIAVGKTTRAKTAMSDRAAA